MKKRVSIIMGCKNSKKELIQSSIKSILCQTFSDFELIIVDDGSKTPIEKLVRSFTDDSRIKFFINPESGLGAALNHGINNAEGEYIARLDDDDLMVVDRLEKQVAYLDNHPDVSCVGSHRYSYCSNKYLKHHKFPLKHDDIVKSLLSLKFSMAHSALMFRRDCIEKIGGYRIAGGGQDLDLLLQMSLVGKLANIDEYLIYYYVTMGSFATVTVSPRLRAYLFALEQIQEKKAYPQYEHIIQRSISRIKCELEDNKKPFYWKKWVQIVLVKLIGKKIPNVL